MAFNGNGTFLVNSAGQPVVTGTVISATTFNTLTADLATGLTNCMTRDGQSPPTANVPMGSFKLTGLAVASATGDALSYGQAGTVSQWSVTQSQTGSTTSSVLNVNAGTNASSAFVADNGTSTTTLFHYGTGVTPGSVVKANGGLLQSSGAGGLTLNTSASQPIYFGINSTLVARFDTGGSLLIGTTTTAGWSGFAKLEAQSANGYGLSGYVTGSVGGPTAIASRVDNTAANLAQFFFSTGSVGSITTNGTITVYNTTSDYRLKDVTGPLTGSGDFIDALSPKVGTWKSDGSAFVGLIAHEVQEVSPTSVHGEKDAVHDGNPVYQAVGYASPEIIANMVAELQSLRARVAALEAK
jgi:hypothetical protein